MKEVNVFELHVCWKAPWWSRYFNAYAYFKAETESFCISQDSSVVINSGISSKLWWRIKWANLLVQLEMPHHSAVLLVQVNLAQTSTDTHVRPGSGDPRLQQEREARLVEPAGGLHGDEDVLQLQFRPGDMCALRARVTSGRAAPVASRVLRVLGRGWRLPDGPGERAGCRMMSHAAFGKAAGA